MCNCSKKCNCNITQITKGEKGDNGTDGANGTNGTDGTNAFKFVKEFEFTGIEIVLSYSEITTCNPIPQGCYADGTVYNETVDYHVQLWYLLPPKIEGQPYHWLIVNYSEFEYLIDATTGDVILSLFETLSNGTYRLVILA